MKYRNLILSIIALLFISCEERFPLNVKNNSESEICLYMAWGNGGLAYPDTTLSIERKYIGYCTEPGNTAYYTMSTFSIEESVAMLPLDTLSIYLFSRDTLDYYNWEEIQTGYKVLARYDLSIENIQKLNHIIPYPPTSEMWYMKMYPSYEYYENKD